MVISEDQEMQWGSGSLWSLGVKRLADLIGAAVLLIVLSPLFLLIALLVKVTSHGPVFFRQERAGFEGRVFRPFKFRTMRGDRKPDPKEIVPLTHGDITTIGRFLRRYKLDELPQLLNVLAGDMSIVGPRPTLPDQVAAYDAFRRQRLLVKPGITGLAQVYSSALDSWDERILYDVAYVRRCGFLLDGLILARTLMTVALGEQRTRRSFVDSALAKHVEIPEGFDTSKSTRAGSVR